MPSVDLLSRVGAGVSALRGPEHDPVPTRPWDDGRLREVTASVQRALRRDCPELLHPLVHGESVGKEILGRIHDYLARDPALRLPGYSLAVLARQIFDHVAGLGPLQPLLDDPQVAEIAVNRYDDVWIEVDGHLRRAAGIAFRDDLHVFYVTQRILAPLGLELSAASPMVTGRLPGNVRVAASMPPAGPHCTLNIRKPALQDIHTEEYVRRGFASPAMLRLLQSAAAGRANILIAGPTGTGKSTLLRYLGRFIPPDARVLVLETTAELGLERFHPHVVSLECRAGGEDRHGIEMADLLLHALHRRPDYIIVGEVRGPEALQLLLALSTGHAGASTVHAESPDRLFDRLSLAILQARLQISNEEILRYLAQAVDLVAYVERMADGIRRLTRIAEIDGFQNGNPVLRDLYRFEAAQIATGRITGEFVPVREPGPRLTRKLAHWGVAVEAEGGPVS